MILRCGGVPEHFNYPWQIALENGYFKEEGIEVTWTDYKGGTGAMCQDLREDRLDLAVLLTEGAIADIANGNPSLIHSIYVSSPLIWGIHTGFDSPHLHPDDAGPIRYAVSRMGSGSHLMALVDRFQRGLDLSEAAWIIIQNLDGARASLIKQESDYFLWEKNMTAPYVHNGELRRIGECPTPWPSVVLTLSKQAYSKASGDLSGITRALQKAIDFFHTLPDPAKTIADVYAINAQDAAAWYAAIQWTSGKSLSKTDFERTASYLQKAGILKDMPVYSNMCL